MSVAAVLAVLFMFAVSGAYAMDSPGIGIMYALLSKLRAVTVTVAHKSHETLTPATPLMLHAPCQEL